MWLISILIAMIAMFIIFYPCILISGKISRDEEKKALDKRNDL